MGCGGNNAEAVENDRDAARREGGRLRGNRKKGREGWDGREKGGGREGGREGVREGEIERDKRRRGRGISAKVADRRSASCASPWPPGARKKMREEGGREHREERRTSGGAGALVRGTALW